MTLKKKNNLNEKPKMPTIKEKTLTNYTILKIKGASPVVQRLSLHVPLWQPSVHQFGSWVQTYAPHVKACCGWHPIYEVEEDRREC